MPHLPELLDVAVDAARAAGALLRDGLRADRTSVETKTSRTDMVTEMDRASEELITARLRAARPGDAIVGEEGTADTGTSGVRWVVDPLDGTTNYLYGFPACAVSIAAEVGGQPAVGVVYDIFHDELFRAARSEGAWCDGRRLQVSGAAELATALVGTGFSYDAANRARQSRELAQVLPLVRDIRRAGAAALDLCWVAAGRLDAFYERGLQPWDWAAGALVAAEAGAVVATFEDGTGVASAPGVFDALRLALERAIRAPA